MKRVAIIGTGIAGLGAARRLAPHADVTVFEKDAWIGGHSHTVDVTWGDRLIPVDTGFIVYNEKNYPNLTRLFAELGVPTEESDMSFGVSVDDGRLEYGTERYNAIFGQRRNVLNFRFLGLLLDILRFFRTAPKVLNGAHDGEPTLGAWLERSKFGRAFIEDHLLPMAAAIWSSPKRRILDFPLDTFVRFCRNHGLLQILDRPQWRTVEGGGRTYVRRIVAALPDVRCATPVQRIHRRHDHVVVDTQAHPGERFDEIVLACHSDQARALLADASPAEDRLLGRVRYQRNRVVLHTDASLLPRRRRAWAAWNYLAADDADGTRPVAVSYLINKLQPLPCRTPVIVTLNPPFEPAPAHRLREFAYDHPLLDAQAVAAQRGIGALQGDRRTWFAGAWLGYGFHEDGLASAHAVADAIARGARAGAEAIAA